MNPRLRSLLLFQLPSFLAGTTLVCAYDIFSDVPESSWFYEDVMDAVRTGVVSGYPDGTYRPHQKGHDRRVARHDPAGRGLPRSRSVNPHLGPEAI